MLRRLRQEGARCDVRLMLGRPAHDGTDLPAAAPVPGPAPDDVAQGIPMPHGTAAAEPPPIEDSKDDTSPSDSASLS
ncbi:hypothetical protein GCM10010313_03610 [Streptomyces violarus]|nr:hypothetical protein GCM10010313_03610 [Streptomyces violarus]